jgi:hypothetical protein
VALVDVPNGEAWLARPILRGLCRMESLHDGSLRLADFARANLWLDVEDENTDRIQRAAAAKG